MHHIHILSNDICGFLRKDTCYFKVKNISTIKDYVGGMSANFNLEI